jgi:hypothetical protein
MGRNNDSYRFFQEMLDGVNNNAPGMVEHGARCLMDLDPANPYADNSPESELFFQMYLYHARWKNGTVEAKINLRKLNATATELCKLVKVNPYTYSKEEEAQELQAKREAQKKEEELKRQQEEQKRIEELKRLEEEKKEQMRLEEQRKLEEQKRIEELKRLEEQKMLEEQKIKEEQAKAEEKEKKSWLKFLFPWKKEGESNDGE